MTFRPERYIGFWFVFLVFSVVAPPVADWCRGACRLPAGYGAEGDRRRVNPIPALVRPAVEELSAGSEGSWVGERAEDGAWVYELHVSRGGKESVIRLTSNGRVLPPAAREPEPGEAVEAAE